MIRRVDMKKNELPDWDDGRTIVNMDVEGMPWNNRPSYLKKAWNALHSQTKGKENPSEPMSPKETRLFAWGAVKAGLLVVGVISLAIVLFILFCQYVWFR